MLYDVTYQLAGEERTERLDAPDAAGAAASVRDAHIGTGDRFELLLVHLVEAADDQPAVVVGSDAAAADA